MKKSVDVQQMMLKHFSQLIYVRLFIKMILSAFKRKNVTHTRWKSLLTSQHE
ncbi:unnamed protein product [Paramecium pentaurelia]|uniref:Uncharacterized protein n=1 Tax=Paramecium pentaurelia TaxID=43138 RepID=A0A8S1SHE1_9CILI|nr:unnamed protein product [Paramecium pentaurelia]